MGQCMSCHAKAAAAAAATEAGGDSSSSAKRSSSSSSKGEGQGPLSFARRVAALAKEQRARFYILRRCVTMLLCWHIYGRDS